MPFFYCQHSRSGPYWTPRWARFGPRALCLPPLRFLRFSFPQFFSPAGQHRLQHQNVHREGHGPSDEDLLRSGSTESLQPDEKGLLPSIPPLWHLSAPHQAERPRDYHVPQEVTLLCVQWPGRGLEQSLGLVGVAQHTADARRRDFGCVKKCNTWSRF